MDAELVMLRVASGRSRFLAGPGRSAYYLQGPTLDHRLEAQEEHAEAVLAGGLMSEGELLAHLEAHRVWLPSDSAMLATLAKHIDDFKVGLYRATPGSNEERSTRKALAAARKEASRLSAMRHSRDHLSTAGHASVRKVKVLVGRMLRDASGAPVYPGSDFWAHSGPLLEAAVSHYLSSRPSDSELRAVARSEAWRAAWSARSSDGLFGTPSAGCTEDQLRLAGFSEFYDSVRQHEECPPGDVINDDDRLDGWAITVSKGGRQAPRALDCQNVFVRVVSEEEAEAYKEFGVSPVTVADVEGMNDEAARRTKKRRFDSLEKAGELNELEMPDTNQRLVMEFNKGMVERAGV